MMTMKKLYDKYRNIRSFLVLFHFKSIYGKKFSTQHSVYVRKAFTLAIEENGHVSVGSNVFFNNYCSLNALDSIEIGDNCIFGESVHVYDHNHKYKAGNIPINNQGFTIQPVVIKKNTWIGSHVTILKGVTIGEHCVIGAGCTIYKDIPDNCVVMCSPKLTVKEIHDEVLESLE